MTKRHFFPYEWQNDTFSLINDKMTTKWLWISKCSSWGKVIPWNRLLEQRFKKSFKSQQIREIGCKRSKKNDILISRKIRTSHIIKALIMLQGCFLKVIHFFLSWYTSIILWIRSVTFKFFKVYSGRNSLHFLQK